MTPFFMPKIEARQETEHAQPRLITPGIRNEKTLSRWQDVAHLYLDHGVKRSTNDICAIGLLFFQKVAGNPTFVLDTL